MNNYQTLSNNAVGVTYPELTNVISEIEIALNHLQSSGSELNNSVNRIAPRPEEKSPIKGDNTPCPTDILSRLRSIRNIFQDENIRISITIQHLNTLV